MGWEMCIRDSLGADRDAWKDHDASELMRQRKTPFPAGILVDQGAVSYTHLTLPTSYSV